MSKRAEQAALKAYPSRVEVVSNVTGTQKDLREFARECYGEGYEQAEKDLGWRSVEESLPEDGKYVFIRSKEEYKDGTPMLMTVAYYDRKTGRWYDYDSECWSADYWMPCPKIPEE